MTQALNLANFANNLNSAGATSNAGLQNSAVTVTAGTGMSGGGSASLGGSVTLTNAGVTSVTGAGTVSVSASTGSVTITGTGGSGTVTSVATGNGLTGGTITSTGTLSLDYYTGSSAGYASYPVGSYLLLGNATGGGININATSPVWTPYLGNGNVFAYSTQGSGSTSCAGTWRARGVLEGSTYAGYLVQRTA
jgi:hypothetical protein